MPVADKKDTKKAILDAAEQLMADHGVNGVSLRRILNEAGANTAALHYHFNSREGLVEALVARGGYSSSVRRKELVDALAGRPEPPTIPELVDVIVDPMAEMLRTKGDAGRQFFRFLARLQSDRTGIHRELDERHFPEIFTKLEPMLRRACPHLSESDLNRRINMVLDTMLQSLANADFMTEEWHDDAHRGELDEYVRSLKSFLAGGLAAP